MGGARKTLISGVLFLRQRISLEGADDADALIDALRRGDAFEMGAEASSRVLRRERMVPQSGIFRLLIPRVVATLSIGAKGASFRVKPDGLALFFLFMLSGALVVELSMPRADYPREYPPEFIFGLAGAYLVALVVESFLTSRALLKLVRSTRG